MYVNNSVLLVWIHWSGNEVATSEFLFNWI